MAREFDIDANTNGLWHMDGSAGSAAKKDNAEGTAALDITEVSSPTSATGFNGEADGAYRLESGPTLRIDDNAAIKPANVTVMIWWKFATLSGDRVILDKGLLGGDYAIFVESGNIKFRIRTNGTDKTVDGGAFSDTTNWKFFALTYDGSELKGYINGSQVGSTVAATGTYNTSTQNLLIGSTSGGGNVADGYADELHISDRAWTATEISNYYNAILPLTITDGVKIGDIATSIRLVLLTITEGLKLGDIATSIRTKFLTIVDGLKLGDIAPTIYKTWTRLSKTVSSWTGNNKPDDTNWTNTN